MIDTTLQQRIDQMFVRLNPKTVDAETVQTADETAYSTTENIRILTFNTHMRLKANMSLLMTELVMDQIDVALIIETGLSATTYRDPIIIGQANRHGYRVISSPYLQNQNLHMLFLIRSSIKVNQETLCENGRQISLEIQGQNDKNTRIMGVYCGFDDNINGHRKKNEKID